jgi:hypothetical protein
VGKNLIVGVLAKTFSPFIDVFVYDIFNIYEMNKNAGYNIINATKCHL